MLLVPGPEILLLRMHEPGKDGASWWVTPGGGVDPGEDDAATLRRELAEEVGLARAPIGPMLWTRAHTLCWRDDAIAVYERFYLVALPERPTLAPTLVDDGTLDHRWWTPHALEASDEAFAPRRLPALLRALLDEGPPPSPFDAGL